MLPSGLHSSMRFVPRDFFSFLCALLPMVAQGEAGGQSSALPNAHHVLGHRASLLPETATPPDAVVDKTTAWCKSRGKCLDRRLLHLGFMTVIADSMIL